MKQKELIRHSSFDIRHSTLPLIRFGHSPDPDDAFMFWGLASGKVSVPHARVTNVLKDIESLNHLAQKKKLEVTAVSVAAYPRLAQNYWIMTVGASVGRNYGPILVSRTKNSMTFKPDKKNRFDLKGIRVGIPGRLTTAYLVFRIYGYNFKPVFIKFDKIVAALKKNKIDAGLMIHEGQLTYARLGLRKIMDLGELWGKSTGLPLPLGLDLVRKDLGKPRAREIATALYLSIKAAEKNMNAAMRYALKFGRGISPQIGKKFVRQYVNQDTLDLDTSGRRSVIKLTRLSSKLNGTTTKPIDWKNTFISPLPHIIGKN